MWTYEQKTGHLWHEGILVAIGYSGDGAGVNNPAMEAEINIGPIPRGEYLILKPSNTLAHGPYVLPLVPGERNKMFGRAGFLIHGDSIHKPGCGSRGCIILLRATREQIWTSRDYDLTVI